MRILGLDYGKERIGIAISDENEQQAFPKTTIKNKSWNFVFSQIKEIVSKEEVKKIVVGFPITMSGVRKEAAFLVEKFIIQLKESTVLPIELEDERLTTKLIISLFKTTPRKIKKKVDLDQKAAVLILQNYLDRNTKK